MTPYGPQIILPGRFADEIRNDPDLSSVEATVDVRSQISIRSQELTFEISRSMGISLGLIRSTKRLRI